ncbi:hypothetical protein Q3G72_027346 [Acer saccharum]|nr:hypothetical protein Q3G72_027346 [Acer saccharum]
MYNLQILCALHLNYSIRKTRNKMKHEGKPQVVWRAPPLHWIKVNSDGLSKGNPGPAAYGAVYRSSEGDFIGCFAMKIGCNTSFFAELSAVIHAIEIAYQRGWRMLWIESDSIAVLQCLQNNKFCCPWLLRNKWLYCLDYMKSMTLGFSHIYMKGNCIADRLN